MHDIDRTHMETEWESDPFSEYEAMDEDEYASEEEYEDEYEFAYAPEYEEEGDYEEEYDEFESYATMNGAMSSAMSGEVYDEYEGVFDEAEEMELAADLLEVTNDAEMDQFLGKLFKKIKKKVGRAIKSPIGRTLVKGLKGIAKKALPIAGRVAGGFFGGPAGSAIGGKLAAGAGKLFGLELEGLSAEDQEFEVARRYVRLAGEAAQKAALAPPQAPAEAVAKKAVAAAVKKHAPGLLPSRQTMRHPMRGRAGKWQRKGKHLILYNVY